MNKFLSQRYRELKKIAMPKLDDIFDDTDCHDVGSIVYGFFSPTNFKLLSILFLIFLLVVSDVFTTNILSRFKGAVDYKNVTTYGVVLQGVFLIAIYALADAAIKRSII